MPQDASARFETFERIFAPVRIRLGADLARGRFQIEAVFHAQTQHDSFAKAGGAVEQLFVDRQAGFAHPRAAHVLTWVWRVAVAARGAIARCDGSIRAASQAEVVVAEPVAEV